MVTRAEWSGNRPSPVSPPDPGAGQRSSRSVDRRAFPGYLFPSFYRQGTAGSPRRRSRALADTRGREALADAREFKTARDTAASLRADLTAAKNQLWATESPASAGLREEEAWTEPAPWNWTVSSLRKAPSLFPLLSSLSWQTTSHAHPCLIRTGWFAQRFGLCVAFNSSRDEFAASEMKQARRPSAAPRSRRPKVKRPAVLNRGQVVLSTHAASSPSGRAPSRPAKRCGPRPS
jgi:hypothetical protein